MVRRFLAAALCVLAVLGLGGAVNLEGAETQREKNAAAAARPRMAARLAAKQLKEGDQVFLRIFKMEGTLELWLKPDQGKRFILFDSYPICAWSGSLGPKTKTGDRQAPEGFYAVGLKHLNPYSSYHLSFDLGYPNAYDRAKGYTGSYLMVHGNCLSDGCYAMTDKGIEEIYTLVKAALEKGQPFFRVHCFPFKMTKENLAQTQKSPWHKFWLMLAPVYDYFEKRGLPPEVTVDRGEYKIGPAGGRLMTPTNNRELSWLAFNDRVLQEACDPEVPLVQRLRFLGIFSNNQDEFIKVRLPGLIRRAGSKMKSGRRLSGGYLPVDLLRLIDEKIHYNQRVTFETFQVLVREMEEQGLRVLDETRLSEEQRRFCLNYFAKVVGIRLGPIIIHKNRAIPHLMDDQAYLGIRMARGSQSRYAVIPIPVSRDCPRFVILPPSAKKGTNRCDIIFVDDIIRLCLGDIFFMFNYFEISAHTFKITRDAILTLDDDISTSLVEKMEKGLERRLQGRPVRLVYDRDMPQDLLALLLNKLDMRKGQISSGGRYHMMRDLMKFPLLRPDLEAPETPPLPHPEVVPFSSIFKVIRHKDILLNYPYQTFNHFVDFLREAAIDPKVTSIYITLYRTADSSKVINALVNAARNGKNVVALVELMARFDEEKNVANVAVLQRAGVKVLDGIRDLKVHGKIVLVERGERDAYAYIGTGNFNEATAALYGDLGLFTAHSDIVADVRAIFSFMFSTHRHFKCRRLLAAPYFMRQALEELIEKEIRAAKRGEPAYIHLKCNTLTDERLVRMLYKAGQAGVEVRLIVRGASCLMPGVEGLSENIRVISIVDKFLEHSRIYFFANGGNEKVFISSADWMTRNLDKRLEVAVPIEAENIRLNLRDFFNLQWADNIKARDLRNLGANTYVTSPGPKLRAQAAVYTYYKNLAEEKHLL